MSIVKVQRKRTTVIKALGETAVTVLENSKDIIKYGLGTVSNISQFAYNEMQAILFDQATEKEQDRLAAAISNLQMLVDNYGQSQEEIDKQIAELTKTFVENVKKRSISIMKGE